MNDEFFTDSDFKQSFTVPRGRVVEMPFEEYRKFDAANAHGLMILDGRSPLHFRQQLLEPTPPSPQQALGTLAHLRVLQPDEYARTVRVAPNVDRRTKLGKAEYAEWQESLPEDVVIATQEQADICEAIYYSCMSQENARKLLTDGKSEQTLIWTDDATGVKCKARTDKLCEQRPAIVDLKTATDASEEAFRRACGSYKYHMQAAWYERAARECGLGVRTFVFVVVETAPPYGVALYDLDVEALTSGDIRCQRALEKYAEAKQTGKYEGYPQEIQTLSLSKWAL